MIDGLRLRTPDMRIAGLTATPFRLDSGRLDLGDERIFDDIVYEANVRDLIREGFLSPLISKGTATRFDLTGVARRGGEYVPAALERAVDIPEVTKAAVAEMVGLGRERRAWLAFCSGVDHATHVCDAVRSHGIRAEVVTGYTPAGERDRIVRDFKAGAIRCLTSVSVLFTGFNAPNVDLVALMRPTCSAGVFLQSVGRGFRLAPGKADCLVLDYAGLVKKFGPVDTIEVTHGYIKPDPDAEKEVRAKECPDCKALLALNTRQCPFCDHAFTAIDEGPKHDATADGERSILSNAPPAWVAVSNWRFYRHEKMGRTPTLRVEYSCGLAVHREWVCVEHPIGYARSKAADWWLKHSGALPVPTTVDDARRRSGELTPPSEILVKPAGKYFEIAGARTRERVAA
jgi:DNA repair protein RadD